MHRRKRRILKSLVLGFAVAAFAAPAALGEPRGPGNPDPLIADAIRYAPSPDDRSFNRGTTADVNPVIADKIRAYRNDIVSPDDRAYFRGVEPSTVPVSFTVSASSDNFQWGDAGLGAASMLGLVLLLGAATLVVRHQRRRLAAF